MARRGVAARSGRRCVAAAWLVDGTPLPADRPRAPVYWLPESIGFVQLTVIDAQGRSAHSAVRLSP